MRGYNPIVVVASRGVAVVPTLVDTDPDVPMHVKIQPEQAPTQPVIMAVAGPHVGAPFVDVVPTTLPPAIFPVGL